MKADQVSHSKMKVTEIGEFLRKPPAGFSVMSLSSGYRVYSDPEETLVLIDDLHSCMGNIVFQKSLGRKVKVNNLWEYTSFRKSLLSRRIYLLISACEENFPVSNRKAAMLKQYVVSIDGNDPFIKWQMEKGLDWTISSVAGESYRVDIDLTEALESWADLVQVEPVWRDASFTLKYYSDALFDFPHWFGFSKRTFKLRLI
ncbi:mesenteric estrogen-dependent adipogenesis protein-like isoform X2 [Scomber japonicus]|uniref:mesenteric estrogen-dependent adipogenesis protein-like isoform X2 n=1 Tax=Scomber japonicus TaxID=13676 RepID=UPI0023064CE0|nr:mesenteric estrogen-dependent adipogenesis protein-like isoform X2 [Scomber japonicus]